MKKIPCSRQLLIINSHLFTCSLSCCISSSIAKQGPHSQPPKGITQKQPTIITKKIHTHKHTHFGSHVFSPLTVNPANAATCGAKGEEGPKLRLQQGDGRVERSCLTMPPGELHPRKCTTPGALMHLRLHRFVTLKVERTRRTT